MKEERIKEQIKDAVNNSNFLDVKLEDQEVKAKINYGGVLKIEELPDELEVTKVKAGNGFIKAFIRENR